MSREARMWIVLGIALLTATAATAVVVFAVQRRQIETKRLYVVVAKKNLEMGTTIAESDVRLVSWPIDSPPPGHFTTTAEVKDKPLVAAVLANEPITKSKLAEPGGSGLTPIIKPNLRAMSVKVNEVIGVAGFVTPGTRVDVLVTLNQDKESISRIVVQNVEVLTAGAKYDDPEARRQGKPIPSTVVTLMVTPGQAEVISLAASQGQITLALRNPTDQKPVDTPGYRKTKFFAEPAAQVVHVPAATGAQPPAKPRPPTPASSARCFETFKAGKREVVCP